MKKTRKNTYRLLLQVLGDAIGVEGVQHIIASRRGLGADGRGAAQHKVRQVET
jgi:hypothetical protein